MTSSGDPGQQLFWLVSRALGVVALVLLAVSVTLGLVLSGRLARRPGLPGQLKRLHEASTLVVLAVIAAHALILLADGYLRPRLADIALPFALEYQRTWTALGIIAFWLALVLGLSFYIRKQIGVATWRWLHRWTLAVYVLALAHTLGAGTDAGSPWLLALIITSTAPVVFAATYRMMPSVGPRRPAAATATRDRACGRRHRI